MANISKEQVDIEDLILSMEESAKSMKESRLPKCSCVGVDEKDCKGC